MSDQKSGQNAGEEREKLRKQLQETFGDVDSIGIEPLLDEALEQVAGGAAEAEVCSYMWCSNKTGKDAEAIE